MWLVIQQCRKIKNKNVVEWSKCRRCWTFNFRFDDVLKLFSMCILEIRTKPQAIQHLWICDLQFPKECSNCDFLETSSSYKGTCLNSILILAFCCLSLLLAPCSTYFSTSNRAISDFTSSSLLFKIILQHYI